MLLGCLDGKTQVVIMIVIIIMIMIMINIQMIIIIIIIVILIIVNYTRTSHVFTRLHETTSEPAREQLACCTDDVPHTAHGTSSGTRGLGSSIIREGNAAALKRTSAHSHPDYTSWQV